MSYLPGEGDFQPPAQPAQPNTPHMSQPFSQPANQSGQPPFNPNSGPWNAASGLGPPPPDNNMVLSIVGLVLSIVAIFTCCIGGIPGLILAIVGMVKSSNVSSQHARGDYNSAQESAASAKKWGIASIIATIAGVILSIILFFALALSPVFWLDENQTDFNFDDFTTTTTGFEISTTSPFEDFESEIFPNSSFSTTTLDSEF